MTDDWTAEAVDVESCLLSIDVRPGSRAAVLILHGQLGVRGVFRPYGDAIGEGTVAIPDLRGRGESVCRDAALFTWPRHVADVVAILDQLDADEAVLAGGSFGSGIAIATALAWPTRVRALVLWASPYLGTARGWTTTQAELMRSVLDMAAEVRAHGLDAGVDARARDHPMIDKAALRARWQRHDPTSIATALVGLGAQQPFEDIADLAKIDVPVAVAPGNDDLHPAHIGEEYLRMIPSARPIVDTPAEFATFVDSVR